MTLAFDQQKITAGLDKHKGKEEFKVVYGTAGFRMDSSLLDAIMFKVGIVAALRSKALCGQAVGVMITASHNPSHDNGVKIVEPMGDMLVPEWEKIATDLCNVYRADQFPTSVSKIMSDNSIDSNKKTVVIVGKDTRPSGERLLNALLDGIYCFSNVEVVNIGDCTTPQLHYMVRTRNDPVYGDNSLDGYYKKLSTAYNSLTSDCVVDSNASQLIIDGANGIGSAIVKQFIPYLNTSNHIKVVNSLVDQPEKLNSDCGSDYVKVGQKLPSQISNEDFVQKSSVRCCSFDGDADRVVYYFVENGQFQLLDGDYLSALYASFISELLAQIPQLSKVTVGVVQTAYANGASTRYFNSIKVPVVCTSTGVKHLHHEAQQFGIGVYFEANGHGTVLFSEETVKQIKILCKDDKLSSEEKKAVNQLHNVLNVINQTVGDALSDMLLVEAIMHIRKWSCAQWKRLYTDMPNKLLKVKVADRSAFKAVDADRKLVAPSGLQQKIDQAVAKYSNKNARSFVRPSGTEDYIRVYAEADDQDTVDKLGSEISQLVYDFGGGVGDRPL
ncbi:hypothetical protein MP228_003320 [Amoeboaphelidium protococcarum]|nr:hypothetical protein MP228_003320 [Amoeboaphelidium protococcarum]